MNFDDLPPDVSDAKTNDASQSTQGTATVIVADTLHIPKKHKRGIIDDEAGLGSDDDDEAPRRRARPSDSDDDEGDGLDAELNDPNFMVRGEVEEIDDDDDVNIIFNRKRKNKKETKMTELEYDDLIDTPEAPVAEEAAADDEEEEQQQDEDDDDDYDARAAEPLSNFIDQDIDGIYDEDIAENREDVNKLMEMLFPIPTTDDDDGVADAARARTIMDPTSAAEQMITSFDDELRSRDVPERLMMMSSTLSHVQPFDGFDDINLQAEAAWITHTLLSSLPPSDVTSERVRMTEVSVCQVLLSMVNHHYEVKFIATYQQDMYQPFVEDKDLWTIFDLDKDWLDLMAERSKLMANLEKLWDYCDASNDDDDEGRRRVVHDIQSFFPFVNKHFFASVTDLKVIQSMQKKLKLLLSCASLAKTSTGMVSSSSRFKQSSSSSIMSLYARARGQESIRKFCEAFFPKPVDIGLALSGRDMSLSSLSCLTPLQLPPNEALDYIGESIFDFEDVLSCAKALLAVELALDPFIYKAARAVFVLRATVWTSVTDKGLVELTSSSGHDLWGLHELHGKPVVELMDGLDYMRIMFLKMMKARDDGLIHVHIKCLSSSSSSSSMSLANLRSKNKVTNTGSIIDALSSLLLPILSSSSSSFGCDDPMVTSEWLTFRASIIRTAFTIMLPQLRREVEQDVLVKAKLALGRQVGLALDVVLNTSSVRPSSRRVVGRNDALNFLPEAKLVVIAIYVSPDTRDNCALVVVNAVGKVVDSVVFNIYSRTAKHEIAKLILMHAPDAILMNAGGVEALRLEYELRLMITIPPPAAPVVDAASSSSSGQDRKPPTCELLMIGTGILRQEQAESEECDKSGKEYSPSTAFLMILEHMTAWKSNGYLAPDVLVISDNVAVIYANSNRSSKEFSSSSSSSFRCAVSMARFGQNPLAEVVYAWTSGAVNGNGELEFGREMLRLKIHPYQGLLADSALLKIVERKLIDTVAASGVRLDYVCQYTHYSGLLWFVCGLGPRKATALIKSLSSSLSLIHARSQLKGKYLSPTVYENAIGFIRVVHNTNDDGDYNGHHEVDLLANSRIHPNMETWVADICASCIDQASNTMTLNDQIRLVRQNSMTKMMEMVKDNAEFDPFSAELDDWLNNLDIDQYSSDLLLQQGKSLKNLLVLIKHELQFPFYVYRPPLTSLCLGDRLDALTTESDAILFPGARVGCVLKKVKELSAFISVPDMNVTGFLRISSTPFGRRGGLNKDDQDMSHHYADGQSVNAVVIRICKSNILPAKWRDSGSMEWVVEVSLLDSDLEESINKDVLAHYLFDYDGYEAANVSRVSREASANQASMVTMSYSSFLPQLTDKTISIATHVARQAFMQRMEPRFDHDAAMAASGKEGERE